MRIRDNAFVYWILAEKWDAFQDVIRETCHELELDEVLEGVPPEAADERYTLLRPFVSSKISFSKADPCSPSIPRTASPSSGIHDDPGEYGSLLVRRCRSRGAQSRVDAAALHNSNGVSNPYSDRVNSIRR